MEVKYINKSRKKVSKTISYILRHNPEKFGLKLNPDGTVKINKLINALKEKNIVINKDELYSLVEEDRKGRFSIIQNEYIRANYGHSIKNIDLDYKHVIPPDILYHGTARKFESSIKSRGIISKGRKYVHLSENKTDALEVGKRRDKNPIILQIDSKGMHEDGYIFFKGGKKIYLTTEVPVKYLKK